MAPLLRMRGIHKSFPGVHALRGMDLELNAGEVLALLGENGAGKSTLIKILGGAHRPDAGTIEIAGQAVALTSPPAARRAGIGVIFQEFNLIPALSVRENMFLGQERSTLGLLQARHEHQRARQTFERLGVSIDPEATCGSLSIAQQQLVEIARALSQEARILVMDEPSAALTGNEVARLLTIVRELKSQGIGIIYISHRLDEIWDIADRVTILRDGEHIQTSPLVELTRDRAIEAMVGRPLTEEFPRASTTIGEERLVVHNLCRGRAVRDVSFALRRGEILGLTGLVGAGRTEVARLLFGADRADHGTIELDGKRLSIRQPRDAIAAGICLLTEDRKSQGLVLQHTCLENFGLPNLRAFSRYGWLRQRAERSALARYTESLRIKLTSPQQVAATLSGGNQQKIVLAKWLERCAEVILFDEPTRGIDVGAKYEIYVLIKRLAAQGKAILMISSELPEILGMSDRILVMHQGRVTGEITDVARSTPEQVLRLAIA